MNLSTGDPAPTRSPVEASRPASHRWRRGREGAPWRRPDRQHGEGGGGRRLIGRWVIGVCLALLLLIGVLGAALMPDWGASCPTGETCDRAALRSSVVGAWLVHGLALAGLTGGMVTVGRNRPAHPFGDGISDEHAANPARHALLATGFVAATNAITAAALGLASLVGGLMVGFVTAAWWVGLTVFLDALDRLARPRSSRRGSWWRALAVSTVTVGAIWVVPLVVVGVEAKGWSEAFLLSNVVVAGVAGVGTLWSRTVAGGAHEPRSAHRGRILASAVAGSLILPLGLLWYVDVGAGSRARSAELVGDLLNPYLDARPEVAAAPDDGAATPPSPVAERACEPADLFVSQRDLRLRVGTEAMVLVATNRTREACTMSGYPSLLLTVDGQPVELYQARVDHLFTGEPVTPEPVTLEPGDQVTATAWWRGAPQIVTEGEADGDDPQGEVSTGAAGADAVRSLAVLLSGDAEASAAVPVGLIHDPTTSLRDGSFVRVEPWHRPE
ncbi:hypothetical protein GCM10022199_08340 [Marihabitans asiaticum]|uniref:Uncharacterized protein DUF4232 n=1 Tax=Marihabitans asiaticum TaxID=415218 RepID=A0A560WGP9_9MICO|nr:DUF4232 domain-containing protein [Marihabitans asiaticum]TWD16863.1 uncharacterized protein DUF4232 [Marihabitans asiaticum]